MPGTDLDLPAEPPDGPAASQADLQGSSAPSVTGSVAPTPRGKRPRKRRRGLRIAIKVFVALVVLWVIGAAVLMLFGIRDASRAMQDLDRAKSQLSAEDVVGSTANSALQSARQEFSNASSLFDNPILSPAVVIPVVGRQVTSVRDLAHAATQVSGIGIQALGNLKTVLDSPHKSGPARIAALNRLTSLAGQTYNQLNAVDPGPSGSLLGPLASKYNDFVDQVRQVKSRLQNASVVAGSLSRILQGPSNYLLLVANNAEMRAGSGMFLEAGTLSFSQGHVKLGTLVDTGTITVPKGAVTATGDFAARWAWLDPTQDWRNLGLSPNFGETAPLAVQMWKAVEHQQLQGVIAIDVEALKDLLQVTGPVTLSDGTVVSSDGVVQLLLHDEYENITYSTLPAQAARVSKLGALAHSTLDALQDRSLDLKTLATAMSDATAGRHILLWSSDSGDEQAWTSGGVAGQMKNNSMMAAVVSRSGTKLDQYLSVACSLQMTPAGGSSMESQGSLTVTLTNKTPPGQSQYIAGPYPHLGTVYGEYIGFLSVNLPADAARNFYATGASGKPVAWGADGPVWVLAVPVDIKMGKAQTVVVHFELPGSRGSITVEPSARIPVESWTYRDSSFTDATPTTISW
jgi:Protein of unknown function (DUF4012)